jgi:NitT/TauT family transport system permease protein
MKRITKIRGFYSIIGLLTIPVVIVLGAYILKYLVFGPGNFPSPITIFQNLIEVIQTSEVQIAFWNTISFVLLSAISASVLGIIWGFLISRNDNVWLVSQPTIDFFRSIPVTFIIPLAALFLHGGSTAKTIIPLLAFYPAFLIMLLQVRSGVAKQNQERLHSFIVLNGNSNRWSIFKHVTFYEALPDILTGFRVTISYCIVVVTVLEYSSTGAMGSRKGVGYLIYELVSNSEFNSPKVYAYTILVGLMGFILNKIIEAFQYRLTHWVKPKNNSR